MGEDLRRRIRCVGRPARAKAPYPGCQAAERLGARHPGDRSQRPLTEPASRAAPEQVVATSAEVTQSGRVMSTSIDHPSELSQFPGGETVEKGIQDLRTGRWTVEAALVTSASRRMQALGLSIPPAPAGVFDD